MRRITLNNPDQRNALREELRLELVEVLEQTAADSEVRAVILTGAGGNFCSGGDVKTMGNLSEEAARSRMQGAHAIVRLLAGLEKPVVVALEGFAMAAAAGILLLSDFIIAGEGAKIGFPFLRIGLVPDYGLTFTLPSRVGEARARQMFLQAETLGAAEALQAGLVDEIVPNDQVQVRALELARELAARPPSALGLTKQLMLECASDLEAALEREMEVQVRCLMSNENAEGLAAFREKREPKF